MSSNKKMCLTIDTQERQSFSERICDDLSEVILEYLPLKDKFRLECVSKQFQRTIFKKHDYLDIDEIRLCLRKTPNVLDCILKKLPNIRRLEQKKFNDFNGVNQTDIDLIIKYCNHLTAIHCHLSYMSSISYQTEAAFRKKFGSRIVSIYVKTNDNKKLKELQRHLKNVKELNYLSYEWKRSPLLPGFYSFFIPFLEQISHLKNMRKISIQLYKNDLEEQMKAMKTFVENNKCLTHLTILFDITDQTFAEFVFKQISLFNDLIELEIYEIKEHSKEFKRIADNCHKLKSLTIGFISCEASEMDLVFNQLTSFKRLQRLFINCIEYHSGIELILNESLKQMKCLTHLKLGFPTYPAVLLAPTLLTDFEKHLSKLQHLFIRNSIEATEETADILSRLSRLESLVLFADNQSISDLIKAKVKTRCPRIKSIREMPF